jgi:hypothetical protein
MSKEDGGRAFVPVTESGGDCLVTFLDSLEWVPAMAAHSTIPVIYSTCLASLAMFGMVPLTSQFLYRSCHH